MVKYHSSHKIRIVDLRPLGSKYSKICVKCGVIKKGLIKPCDTK